jgi:hypothetical protein
MDKFNQIKALVDGITADADKFYNGGNSAAGTRIRKAMQDLKNLASEVRKEVTELKNSGEVKAKFGPGSKGIKEN